MGSEYVPSAPALLPAAESTTMATGNASEIDECHYVNLPYLDERFWLVVVFGAAVSCISLVFNALIFTVFISHRTYRRSNCLYLIVLASFDCFMAISYILLMCVSVLIDYTHSLLMFRAWFFYVRPMITLSHIAMTASSYLILCAVFENFLETKSHMFLLNTVKQRRHWLVVGAILIAVLTKGAIYWEFELSYNSACADTLAEWEIMGSWLAQNQFYHTAYMFYMRHILTIFLPFFLLAFFNLQIVLTLRYSVRTNESVVSIRNSYQMAAGSSNGVSDPLAMLRQQKMRVKRATRILVLVVCTYLVANVVTVIVSIWEHIDFDSLTQDFSMLYAFATDIQSLFTIVGCALRLIIYCSCRPDIRRHIFALLTCRQTSGLTPPPTAHTALTTTGGCPGQPVLTGASRRQSASLVDDKNGGLTLSMSTERGGGGVAEKEAESELLLTEQCNGAALVDGSQEKQPAEFWHQMQHTRLERQGNPHVVCLAYQL